MRYMLDTNICIYTIKHKPETVIRNFLLHNPVPVAPLRLGFLGICSSGIWKDQGSSRVAWETNRPHGSADSRTC